MATKTKQNSFGEKHYCFRCDDEILDGDDAVRCYGQCEGWYHINCSGLSLNTYRNKSEEKKREWMCVDCRHRATTATKPTNIHTPRPKENISLELLNKKIDQLLTLENMIDNMKTEIKTEIKKIEEKFEKKLKEKDEEIQQLKDLVHDMEQYGRNRNLELHNVPEISGENLEKIVCKIGEKLQVEMKKEDIEVVHRIKSRNSKQPPPIIVQFTNRRKRNELLEQKRRKLTTGDIGMDRNDKIYINENLSPYFKNLFWQTRQWAQVNNYKFVWFRGGKLFIREREGSSIVQIKRESDLVLVK